MSTTQPPRHSSMQGVYLLQLEIQVCLALALCREEECAELVIVRLRASHPVGRFVRDSGSAPGTRALWVDTILLYDGPRPELLAHAGRSETDAAKGATRDSKLVQQDWFAFCGTRWTCGG
eukprot:6210901-Pleurochrysis_carterae.AAC.1